MSQQAQKMVIKMVNLPKKAQRMSRKTHPSFRTFALIHLLITKIKLCHSGSTVIMQLQQSATLVISGNKRHINISPENIKTRSRINIIKYHNSKILIASFQAYTVFVFAKIIFNNHLSTNYQIYRVKCATNSIWESRFCPRNMNIYTRTHLI